MILGSLVVGLLALLLLLPLLSDLVSLARLAVTRRQLPSQPPDFARRDPSTLRLYWFSQTIGPGRGLEETVIAAGRAGIAAELALRGRTQNGYLRTLQSLAAAHAPRLSVVHHPPASPDAMVDLARSHDVGLAQEVMAVPNRRLCLTNKAFTYMLAGLAVAMSDTPGQHALGQDLGHGAALVAPGDVDALAGVFSTWANERLKAGELSANAAAIAAYRNARRATGTLVLQDTTSVQDMFDGYRVCSPKPLLRRLTKLSQFCRWWKRLRPKNL
jgi:hypothetical protein